MSTENQSKKPESTESDNSTDPSTKRPKTDADEAVDRANKGSNDNEGESGSAESEAGFDSPNDDPA
jgi:hypothetical protein